MTATKKIMDSIKGFSMVEMMVTVVIFMLVLSGMFAMTMGAQSVWEDNRIGIDLSQNFRKALEAMAYDLRQTSPSSIFDVPADGSTGHAAITFKKPSYISGGAIVWNTYTTKFQLGGSDNRVLQRVENGVTTNLATNIRVLQFQRQAATPRLVQIYVQLEGVSGKGRTIQKDLNFSVLLRNNL